MVSFKFRFSYTIMAKCKPNPASVAHPLPPKKKALEHILSDWVSEWFKSRVSPSS